MEYKAAVSKLQLLGSRLNYLVLISGGLLITNLLLIWLASWALVRQKITIVPAEISNSFTISVATVDASYLRQMALVFALQRLNVTPAVIDQNHGIILHYTDPKFYHDFVAILANEKREVVKQNISAVFYPAEVFPDTKNLSVTLKGSLARWLGGLALPLVPKSYVITFSYNAGALKVLSFTEKLEATP